MTAVVAEPKALTRTPVLRGGGSSPAWQAALVSGLAAKGSALRTAALVLSTSAGAIVGAQLALDIDLAVVAPGSGAPMRTSSAGMGELIKATAQAARTANAQVVRIETVNRPRRLAF